jgi:hypothetical protein
MATRHDRDPRQQDRGPSLKVKTGIKAGDMTLGIDEDGFIQDPEQWDEDVAKALALTE